MYQSIVEVTDVATGNTVIHWESGGSLLTGLEATRLLRGSMRVDSTVHTRTVVIHAPQDRDFLANEGDA